jgi:GT2 family glycosyltransferase/glycosyltransferase involved in cell wall biosynthesis/SAM-dependent methyltransferase
MTLRSKVRRIAGSARRRIRSRAPDWWRGTPWEEIRAAGLFDADWYRGAYPGVSAGDVDAMWEYATRGAYEGRDPNAMFSSHWYLATYPDVAVNGINPLVHYVEHGAREGRDPSPRFDTGWYLRVNPDIRTARCNALGHYLRHGELEGRRPRPVSRVGLRGSTIDVVLVSGEPDAPGHRYRVVRMAEAIRRLGGRAAVLTIPEAASSHLADVDHADLVMLCRTAWCPELERVVHRSRRAGAILVFDVDDLMIDPGVAVLEIVDGIRSQNLTEEDAQKWFALMRRTAQESDACICPTAVLAARLRDLGSPTYVLPNGFDDATFVQSRLAARLRRASLHDGVCRIGYATGSLTHQRDFAVVADPLANVLRANPGVCLVLYRHALDLDEFPAFNDLRGQIEWRDVVALEDLPFELSRFDVNLAPVEVGNPFCEAKSELKFFEAALVDVPTIASPTEPFRSVIVDGVNGFLAGDTASWQRNLSELVSDPELRRSIGHEARVSVMWDFGPQRRLQMAKGIFDQLLEPEIAGAEAFGLELARSRRPRSPAPALTRTPTVLERDKLRASRVTVVVPVHDYADVLTEALESVRMQTLPDLDLVVVDDASTDESREVAEEWLDANAERFNRVVLLANAENAGLARIRNTGFEAAETPFVLPLDADNALLPACCEKLVGALDESAAVFAYPRLRHFGEESELFPPDHVRGYLPYAPQRLIASNYIDALALVRKDAWLTVGGYREGLLGWEDYDLWCRFAELGLPGIQVPEDLALYRVHHASMLHTLTHDQDHLRQVHDAITRDHPWLQLEQESRESAGMATPVESRARPMPSRRPTPPRTEHAKAQTIEAGQLSDRCRRLLAHLRCPETGEPLTELAEGGVASVDTGRVWSVVNGRPVLFPGLADPVVFPPGHRGNPLPDRALSLIAAASGMVLHLSGGGTAAHHERVVELDGALFESTDVIGDAHQLPLPADHFDLVVAMNSFEHYRDPARVVEQLERVLKPGGLVFVRTAFLQPLHGAPDHYFNATKHGVERWFHRFETVDLHVSDNFHPGYALSWIASDAEEALASDVSRAAADAFRTTQIGTFADFWRDSAAREDERWEAFSKLTPCSRERLAAGFEYLGRRST